MIEWIRRINGARSGDIVRAVIASRSFLRESHGATVRLLLAQQPDRTSVFQISWDRGGLGGLWKQPEGSLLFRSVSVFRAVLTT